jgi:GH15 family glucan-1,4-alpha-glucosidase
MYNMEWVRDDMMVMLGLLHAGFTDEAKTVLVKTLEHSVGPDGCAIESSRFSGPDLTELDQNGEILYGAWAYACWTGDMALLRKYWRKIELTADYPLQDVFWDKKSGLLRNKREYWERGGEGFGIQDGFELTYQMWVVLGLEKGVEMAKLLGKKVAAGRWARAAAKLRQSLLEDPTWHLIEDGHFIKRRRRDGTWQEYAIPSNRASLPPGSPIATLEKPALDPDTSSAYPVIYGLIDPKSDLARRTLESMEALWNQSWSHGGYSRYNTTSEPDPPAPWPLATVYLARAFTEAGMDEKAWRALRWVYEIHGGKGGAWFERMGPSITPPAPPVCVVGWVWAELNLLFLRHFAGVRPELERLTIRPRLLKGMKGLNAELQIRGAALSLEVRGGAGAARATVNGKGAELRDGVLSLKYPAKGSRTSIVIELG